MIFNDIARNTMNRNRLKFILSKNPRLFNICRYIYTLSFHRERLMRSYSYGEKNQDKTILIVRPNSEDGIQGLMSLLIQTSRWIQYAYDNDYVPFIDFKTYKTQYYDGLNNSWDFFFEQPEKIKFDEVYNSKNVIISGVSLRIRLDDTLFREYIFRDELALQRSHELLKKSIRFSKEVLDVVSEENSHIHVEECIGVYIRGTDYVKLKPAGEYKQPNIQDVCDKVRGFINKYIDKKIFLVTEDADYYKIMRSEFQEKICIVSFDSFISGYNGRDYLSNTQLLNENRKKRGMDYLIKIILLSRCKYLISSITMGSIVAYCFNGGKYEDKYIFDIGYYE